MKERQTKIGSCFIIQNNNGIKLNDITLTPENVEELINWLRGYKEISYQDRTYLDKRKLLRQLSTKDEIRNYVNIMTDKILEKLKRVITPFPHYIEELQMYHYIKILLIDGFLAFEIIFDEKQKNILDLQLLDPLTIVPTEIEKNVSMGWIQYPQDEKLKRVLLKDQVIYISYSDDEPISYVEELKTSYERVKTLENELMASRMNLPGDINKKLGGEIAFKQLKRADKNLKFMSKIPESILENEETESNDVRYNSFIKTMYKKFEVELFDKLNVLKNNLK